MTARTPTTPPVIRRSVTITLPLTDEQAKAVVRAAPAFGVEPWELGAFALSWRLDREQGRRMR